MKPAEQILSKHWRVTPGVGEMEGDCKEMEDSGKEMFNQTEMAAWSRLAGRANRGRDGKELLSALSNNALTTSVAEIKS